MSWVYRFDERALKELKKLGHPAQREIIAYLDERVAGDAARPRTRAGRAGVTKFSAESARRTPRDQLLQAIRIDRLGEVVIEPGREGRGAVAVLAPLVELVGAAHPEIGRIEAIGPGAFEEEKRTRKKSGKKERRFVPTVVKPGDRVVYGRYAGQTYNIDGEERILVRERDILGILPSPLQIPAATASARETALMKSAAEPPAGRRKAAKKPVAKKTKKAAKKSAKKKAKTTDKTASKPAKKIKAKKAAKRKAGRRK